MVFGQPRQEDLLEFLLAHFPPAEAERHAATLRLDLSPKEPTAGVGDETALAVFATNT
jgi:hypothetical protein